MKVTDSTGAIEYQEGVDYDDWDFEQLGNLKWRGTYHRDHADIPLVIKADGRIKEGQLLKVSYYTVPLIGSGQVGICLSHPKTYEILQKHIRRVNEMFSPTKVFIGCDEIRIIGQCTLCRSRNLTSGEILADAVKKMQNNHQKRNSGGGNFYLG